MQLDLGSVVPSIAGPKRPQDRVALSDAKASFRSALRDYVDDDGDGLKTSMDEGVAETFPASDPVAVDSNHHSPPPTTKSCRLMRRPQLG